MGKIVELTAAETNTFITGAWYPNAIANGMTVVSYSLSSWQTGSWGGLANTWGADSSSLTSSLESGKWGGLANTWGATSISSESIDRTTETSSQNPSPNQGVGAGDWDAFPALPVEVEAPLPQRDVTRFRKSYSSQRSQPKRVRLIRR